MKLSNVEVAVIIYKEINHLEKKAEGLRKRLPEELKNLTLDELNEYYEATSQL